MSTHVRGRGSYARGQDGTIVRIDDEAGRALLRATAHIERLTDAAERLVAATAGSMGCISDPPPIWDVRDVSYVRAMFERGIEGLIAFLDQLDGDPDVEPTAGLYGTDDECEPDNDNELTWPEAAGEGAPIALSLALVTDDDEHSAPRRRK